MDERTRKIKKRYDRISGIYNLMDRMIKKEWRKSLIQLTYGEVLEAGVGTGANLPYYPEAAKVTGIDFSRGMLAHASKKRDILPNKEHIRLMKMDIQQLDFPDESFDFIVSTCVFCSVPNPVQGLRELRRVLKPNGRILMLEHMRSENRTAGLLMDLINPLTVHLWGANINRRTLENIQQAELQIETNDPLLGTILRKLIVKK